ncbi:MAG: calcium-binding protein [Microcoleus sp.]
MVVISDPSTTPRLIRDNTSEFIILAPGLLSGGAWMLGGDDTVQGSENSDLVYGNDGMDFLIGMGGKDDLFGGKGIDLIRGEQGDDNLYGERDADLIFGGVGNDFLFGGKGNDYLNGENGNDTLVGGEGRDILIGSATNEQIKFGSDFYILSASFAVSELNSADTIVDFDIVDDKIGLILGGFSEKDLVLEPIQNLLTPIQLEILPVIEKVFGSVEADTWKNGLLIPASGTAITVKNSGVILGVVGGVMPADLQGKFIFLSEV